MKKIIIQDWYLSQVSNNKTKKSSFFSKEALSVHEILRLHGKLDKEVERGECEKVKWIAESNWIYQTTFSKPNCHESDRLFLNFHGIDTYADIYLNDICIAKNEDCYVPKRVEITDFIQDENKCTVYFHSPYKILEEKKKEADPEWLNYFEDFKLLRKPAQDFHNFMGARPYLTPIGFYRDVELEIVETARISYFDVDVSLAYHNERATIYMRADIEQHLPSSLSLQVEVKDPKGKRIYQDNYPVTSNQVSFQYDISNPELWWPRPYTKHPLYTITISLKKGKTLFDTCTKKVGIRRIEKTGDMLFSVNGVDIRLWGANLTPLQGLSHRWDNERAKQVLQLALDANMNLIRIWGEQGPVPEEFYDYADTNGIMVWQDFYTNTCGLFPDTNDYRAIYLEEVEYLVETLKHHPSIFLWCGNNETILIADSPVVDGKSYGTIPLTEDFPRLLGKLDPMRPYIPSTPYGSYGQPQDPMRGDIHGFIGVWYEPGDSFPVFYSESCHMCMPPLHSFKRFVKKQDWWPRNYTGAFPYPDNYKEILQIQDSLKSGNSRTRAFGSYWRSIPLPETWRRYVSRFAICENWDIEKYYDGVDMESMMYKYTAPAVDYFKRSIERVRRGSLAQDVHQLRRCNGYMIWKLNDAWPYINFTLMDSYLEPNASYYQIKRSYQPIIVSIDAETDHIYLWGVNDSPTDFVGTIHFKVFSKLKNRIEKEIEIPCKLFAGKSQVITNLDHLGGISRECVLYADLRNQKGQIIHRTDAFLDMERNQIFPHAKITMRHEKDELILTTDTFARFVELVGNEDGDEFGWNFEDNYFNLFPFEERRIKIKGRHKKGEITAKAHYSPHITKITL